MKYNNHPNKYIISTKIWTETFFPIIFNPVLFSVGIKWVKAIPAGNYMFKVNNGNTRTKCELGSKLKIKTLEKPLAVNVLMSRENC